MLKIKQLKFNCVECNREASPSHKEGSTYWIKCETDGCKLSIPFVHARTFTLGAEVGPIGVSLDRYFTVEKIY